MRNIISHFVPSRGIHHPPCSQYAKDNHPQSNTTTEVATATLNQAPPAPQPVELTIKVQVSPEILEQFRSILQLP